MRSFIYLSLPNPPPPQGHGRETKKLGIVVSLGTGKQNIVFEHGK